MVRIEFCEDGTVKVNGKAVGKDKQGFINALLAIPWYSAQKITDKS